MQEKASMPMEKEMMMDSSGPSVYLAVTFVIAVVALLLGAFQLFSSPGDAGMETIKKLPVPTSVSLKITNLSDTQPLSPGVFYIYTGSTNLSLEGKISPSELEALAEYGENAEFAVYLREHTDVVEVVTIDAPILPGESTSIDLDLPKGITNAKLGGVMMAVASNDGIAVVSDVVLVNDGELADISYRAPTFDNGTENNQKLGGGFAAGQPDPSKGEANVENGTPTNPQAPVSLHPQIEGSIMLVERM